MDGLTNEPPPAVLQDAMDDDGWRAMACDDAQGVDADWFAGDERRATGRRLHRQVMRINIRLYHPDSSRMSCLVRSQDISESGLRFVHSNDLSPRARCVVGLLQLDHRLTEVRGVIVRCDLRSDLMFDVGVSFDTPIDIKQFVPPSRTRPRLLTDDEDCRRMTHG